MKVGANIRTGLGVPERTHANKYVIKSVAISIFFFILTFATQFLQSWFF